MGGCRVRDASGADDTHGLVAPNVFLLTHDSGARSVELDLNSSKTHHSRIVNLTGMTKGSGVDVYGVMESYIRLAGFETATYREGELTITQPVTYVLRVFLSTLSGDDSRTQLLLDTLARTRDPSVMANFAATKRYVARRVEVKDNANRAYVNVMEGARGCEAFAKVRAALDAAGFTDLHVEAPAPFIRATRGNSVTLMPLAEASTYHNFIDLLPAAEAIVKQRGQPDPYFDLEGRDKSSYGNHSLRRMSDRVANRTKKETNTSDEEIDEMFGWNENKAEKNQRRHYAGRAERVQRARITEYV